jgi:hypothetical protein
MKSIYNWRWGHELSSTTAATGDHTSCWSRTHRACAAVQKDNKSPFFRPTDLSALSGSVITVFRPSDLSVAPLLPFFRSTVLLVLPSSSSLGLRISRRLRRHPFVGLRTSRRLHRRPSLGLWTSRRLHHRSSTGLPTSRRLRRRHL